MKFFKTVLCVAVLVFLFGCTNNVPPIQPGVSPETEPEQASLGFFFVFDNNQQPNFEVGEVPIFVILPDANAQALRFSSVVELVLTQPDGSRIQHEILFNDSASACASCDLEVTPECFEPCKYKPFFVSQKIGFTASNHSYVFYQPGKYTLSGVSQNDILRFTPLTFTVRSSELPALFFEKENNGFELNSKIKVVWNGPHDLYRGVYFKKTGLGSNATAGTISVNIGIALSAQTALEEYQRAYGLNNKWSWELKKDQNIAVVDNDSHGFLAAWPSENRMIGIVGFQTLDANTQAFIDSYLTQYPSSLSN